MRLSAARQNTCVNRRPQKQEEWFGWRPLSVDDLPLLGAPGHRRLWLARHGMLGSA